MKFTFLRLVHYHSKVVVNLTAAVLEAFIDVPQVCSKSSDIELVLLIHLQVFLVPANYHLGPIQYLVCNTWVILIVLKTIILLVLYKLFVYQ